MRAPRRVLLLMVLLCAAAVAWLLLADHPDQAPVRGTLRTSAKAKGGVAPTPVALRGLTVDDAGALIGGVAVDCPGASTVSDAVGSFTCNVNDVPAELDARAAGRALTPAAARARIRGGSGLLRLRLRRPARVAGLVLDAGIGRQGAALLVHYAVADRLDGASCPPFVIDRGVQSGGDGAFELRGLWPGRVRLQARVEGGGEAWSAPLDLRDGADIDGVLLRLGPGGGAVVSVRDGDGPPVAGASAVLDGVVGGPRGQTDAGGEVTLRPLPQGSWTLRIEAAGYVAQRVDVQVSAAGVARVAVTLQRLPPIAARVVDADGAAVAGASVRLWAATAAGAPTADAALLATLMTGADGRVALDPAGLAALARDADAWADASHPAFGPAPQTLVRRGIEAELRLQPPGAIRGVVVDAAGRPVSDAVVWCEPSSGAPTRWGRSRTPQVVRVDGSFAIAPLPPGGYDLRARAADRPPGVQRGVEVHVGGETAGVVIRLAGGAALSGQALLADGAPAADAALRLRCGDDDERTASVGADGSYRIDDAPPGDCVLSARAPGHVLEARRLALPDAGALRVDLRLRAAGAAAVRALPAHGLALAEGEDGLVVAEVRPDSAAARAGLKVGDRIGGIDFRRVGDFTFDEVMGAASAAGGAPITFEVGEAGLYQSVYVSPEAAQ